MTTTSPTARLVFDTIVRQVDRSGRMVCEHFLELPSREALPSYYAVIEDPVCIGDIVRRLLPPPEEAKHAQPGQRYGFRDIRQDFRLMFRNAKKFNTPGCAVYRDALTLERVLKQLLQELDDAGESDEEESYLKSVRDRVQLEKAEREINREVMQAAAQARSNKKMFRPHRSPEAMATHMSIKYTAADPDLFVRGPESPLWFHQRKLGRVAGVVAAVGIPRSGGSSAVPDVNYNKWNKSMFPVGSFVHPRPPLPPPPSEVPGLGAGAVSLTIGGKVVAERLPVVLPAPIAPTVEHLEVCQLCSDPRRPHAAALAVPSPSKSPMPLAGDMSSLKIPTVTTLLQPGRSAAAGARSASSAAGGGTRLSLATASAAHADGVRPVDPAGYDAALSERFCVAFTSGRLGSPAFREQLGKTGASATAVALYDAVASVVESAPLPPEVELAASPSGVGHGVKRTPAGSDSVPAKRQRSLRASDSEANDADDEGEEGGESPPRGRRGARRGRAERGRGIGNGTANTNGRARGRGRPRRGTDAAVGGGVDGGAGAGAGVEATTPTRGRAAKGKGKASSGAAAPQWTIGDVVDMQDESGTWWLGMVVGARSAKVKVHYFGWSGALYDEFVPRASARIAPVHTHKHPVSTVCRKCGFPGLFIICDDCSAAYHLECVKLKAVPRGKWRCPEH